MSTEDRRIWHLGDDRLIRMSDACLAKVMRGLVETHGKMLSSAAFGGAGYKNPNTRSVVFAIELPVGAEEQFAAITGFVPQIPKIATGQANPASVS